MWTWNLTTVKYGYGLSGSWAGLEKLETRLIKSEGIRVLFREPVGGWGAGAETHSTCPETQGQGSHYPLPAPASMNLILKNNKRVREGEGKCRKEWREAGGRMISLGNTWAFLSDNNWQARFHFPVLLQGPRLKSFLFFANRRRWSENRRMTARCCTGVSLRLFTLLLLFLFSTKTIAPGLQVNWKGKNWKSCLNISDFHLWHTILGAEKGCRKFIKKDLCVFGPVFVIVPFWVQCWRSAALQTKTQFYKKEALT